ncbi:MAG: CRISPR-associated helicase Cas3' [Anaerolineales bacterium]|nr:CRISPR-associated helicase Cas3' [Anaerolineales bacterium]
MSEERNRHALIADMEHLYLQRAWSDQEMADQVGTDRTNVYRIRTKVMEKKMQIPFIEEERGRYHINRAFYVAHIKLKPAEALALYIGGRRLQQQTKTNQSDVAHALEKLSAALHKPLAEKMVQAAQAVLQQEQDSQQSQNLQRLMEAWLNGRCVHIKHRKPHGKPRSYTVSPYQLEPALWGDGIYLIGYSDYHNGIASFKLSRIEQITPSTIPFEIPADFNSYEMLRYAWGIWHADEKPVTVRLKFTDYVTPRVKESIWHPEQTIQDLPEGGCIWQAEVAEWKEMRPWVRGWGSDVEVLEPEDLREGVIHHVQRSAKMYKISQPTKYHEARLLHLWGKTTSDPALYHPALYHMLDVAHVAQQLLSSQATPRWRQVLARSLNTDPSSLYEWLPWFIALHDIGKISVPFQAQNSHQRQRLEGEQFDFGRYRPEHKDLHHTIMGRIVLQEWAEPLPPSWRAVFLDMVSGHHGRYQQAGTNHRQLKATLSEPPEWELLRQQAINVLQHCLLLNQPTSWPKPENISAAIVALNGFTILCDWLGSDEQYFKPKPTVPILEYLSISRRSAKARVESAGFFVPAISAAPTTFTGLFGWQTRPLQEAIDNIPGTLLTEPTLTIIEAPTGEGKTEAALTLARRIAHKQGSDEMYIALPTTATSNAMYQRLQEHLQKRLSLPPSLVQLVHGQAFLMQDDLCIEPLDNGDGEPHPALTWFEPKKKSLLAPFGVGTVDQAELAALNVRHNALRLIGLAGKVVILDEVHAYDTYMTTIICRMLAWLAALGSSVVLLSATLPTGKRRQLAEAYTGGKVELEETKAYPYLLTVNSTTFHSANPPAQDASKKIYLHTLTQFAEKDWAAKAQWLLAQAESGGCVCWITNTVERAQRIFQALWAIAPEDVDCVLLHARFPLADRQEIEKDILAKYGKEATGQRPQKGIVVGTQVLEQSLDIDFDLMVTDLAPIDLLLQRIGRLHRHHRPNRPAHHNQPHVHINYEVDEAQQLRLGTDRFYTPYILLKTWQVVEQKANEAGLFNLPADYRPLVEAVYDETPPGIDSYLFKTWERRQKKENKLESEAMIRLANFPDPEDPFYEGSQKEFKEDEESTDWMVAQTRYQERETVTVIPIERVDENKGRIPTVDHLPLHQPIDRDTQLLLLQRSIRVSDPEIVKRIKAEKVPELFSESSLLKRCYPLWLKNNSTQDLPLRLDKRLGLVIEKENPTDVGKGD